MHRTLSIILLGALAGACASGSRRSGFETEPSSIEPAPPPQVAPPASAPPPDDLASPTTPSEPETKTPDTCVATESEATRPAVDVIMVIDTSGSMDEEIAQVKENLNAFARSIAEGGLDYTVVLLARKPHSTKSKFGLCIPPPLGSEDCSDTPLFHHLDVTVESDDSLKIILDQYSNYAQWLRPSAYKVFIEVTDDNSALDWEVFDERLLALSPEQFGDASHRRYIFDSICGYRRGSAILSTKACDTAVNNGGQYQELSRLTGGTVDSVCEESYASVFDNLARGLTTRLACEFSMPKDDGKGHATDPKAVVVSYAGDGAAPKPFTQVADAVACGDATDAWYYDDTANPTAILLCPKTCGSANNGTSGKVAIGVGCKARAPK